ncbi:MAG: hypothetical protein GY789_00085 [Hyphomicrobiales bacterium]|nr:hypothetical protein [Hyphomicrobiales bacterium]
MDEAQSYSRLESYSFHGGDLAATFLANAKSSPKWRAEILFNINGLFGCGGKI